MLHEELTAAYILSDGVVLTTTIDHSSGIVSFNLAVRKHTDRKKWAPCQIELKFIDVFEIYLNKEFNASGQYSDYTLSLLESGEIYYS